MRLHLFVTGLCVLMVAVGGWAKGRPSAADLMAKSDAAYYYPSVQGVKDLVVDLSIEMADIKPVVKDARIRYYYAGPARSNFVIDNIPDSAADARLDIRQIVEPLGEYIMPRTSVDTFKGMTVSSHTVSRQIAGLPGTEFDQLIGTEKLPTGGVRETRILLNDKGLACQVENYLNGTLQGQGAFENIRIGDLWHCSKIIAPIAERTGVIYQTTSIEYAEVDGFVLPTRIAMTFRDQYGFPLRGAADMTIVLRNYRINAGASAQFLPIAGPVALPGTQPLPVQ